MLLEHLPTPSPPLPSLLIRRYSYPGWALGREPLDRPAARGISEIHKPVVEPAGPALPELDAVGFEPVAAPVFRPGNGRILGIGLPLSGEECFKDLAAGDHLALGRTPGADA
jgi:hypothetical protein